MISRRSPDRLKPLPISPLWRYRVGDWRIVAHIEDEVLRVLILRIAHRREVYRRLTRPGVE